MSVNMEDYLVPTDPPAPFPTLTISAGDNDVSFSTTVLPAEFDATFEGWHDGTESVYDGQKWN